jgi:3-oxoadipate enol-lactonase
METASVNGVRIEYESLGSGEPMLFIHGALVAATFAPLVREPAIERCRRIRYHRRGYGGSGHPGRMTNFYEQPADAAALLAHLGVAKAHLVCHSYGGRVALRLALDSPATVATLSLLEPPMLSEPVGAAFFVEPLAPVVGAYQRGEKQRAAELFRDAVGGPNAARTLEERLGAEAGVQAVADADMVFGTDFPEIANGLFAAADAPHVRSPSLSLVGRESHPLFPESHAFLLARLAGVEGVVIPQATHFLQIEQPAAVAAAIAAFAAKHRLS